MEVTLNTGSTIEQGKITKGGEKMTPKYRMAAGICRMNPEDWKSMGSPEKVEVSTDVGSIIVFAKPDDDIPRNEIFIPRGPWANTIISSDTFNTGSPRYKNMPASVKPSDENVLEAGELMKKYYG